MGVACGPAVGVVISMGGAVGCGPSSAVIVSPAGVEKGMGEGGWG